MFIKPRFCLFVLIAYALQMTVPFAVMAQTDRQANSTTTAEIAPGTVRKSPAGIELVWVPAGEFMMGSADAEVDDVLFECRKYDPDCKREDFVNETPKRRVLIREGFWMGRYEVTQGEWKSVMGDDPSDFENCGERCPVEYVSWDDIQVYLKRLNSRDSQFEYSLPSEAHWEYAARSGTTTEFAFGTGLNSTQANFRGDYPYASTKGAWVAKKVKVGSYSPNAWGLYDMHGNVSEWVQDIYNEKGYGGLPVDGSANLSAGDSSYRVLRGGSWVDVAYKTRSAFRDSDGSSNRTIFYGFRLLARPRYSSDSKVRVPVPETPTSPSVASAVAPGTVRKNSIGMELVWIPPGEFMMGSENGEADDEKPVRKVTIREGFWMGKYEVTQGQWVSVMGSNPSNFKNCGRECPVEQVSWNDARGFIGRLNMSNDGFIYSLPSEAQWEYAARAGTMGDYYGPMGEIAWYDDTSGNKTHPVGQKKPNSFGLYDMSGNVSEWVEDIYSSDYIGLPLDGSANTTRLDSEDRVLRGGSWFDSANFARSASRDSTDPSVRNNDSFGFRVLARPK